VIFSFEFPTSPNCREKWGTLHPRFYFSYGGERVDAEDKPSEKDSTTGPEGSESGLNEDLALAALKTADLEPEKIEEIVRSAGLMKSRKVRFALAVHGRTPRRIALRLIRELYTFDLMQFALHPVAAADLKRLADELLVSRLASITLGERIALARRCSATVGTSLLLDKEPRVWQTTLENPRLTEAAVLRAVQRPNATAAFVEALCHHPKWSARPEVRMALLRSAHTPLARALDFARHLPPAQLRDVLHASRLPETIKEYLRKDALSRNAQRAGS